MGQSIFASYWQKHTLSSTAMALKERGVTGPLETLAISVYILVFTTELRVEMTKASKWAAARDAVEHPTRNSIASPPPDPGNNYPAPDGQ